MLGQLVRMLKYSLCTTLLLFVLTPAVLLYGFQVAWHESPLARIAVTPAADGVLVRYYDAEGAEYAAQTHGTHWRITMRQLLWDDWLLVLGLRPMLHIQSLEVENGQQSLVVMNDRRSAFFEWAWRELETVEYLPGVRSVYGIDLYRPLIEGEYVLLMKGSGPVLSPVTAL